VTTKIAIIDDHELLAQSLALALCVQGFTATSYCPVNLAITLDAVLAAEPEVVLLDLQLGEAGHGVSLVRPLARVGARVLVVSGTTDECEIAAALEAGAVGYVSKAQPIDVLLQAARRVAHGDEVRPVELRHQMLSELRRRRRADEAAHASFDRLTCREREVLRGLADGHPVTAIAERCFVSVATVRTQVRAILVKLQVGSQLEAVALAHRHGWYEGRAAVYQRTA
jgi:two-component system, NarL family, nitrate/nitrite response regulator NarL